MPGAANEHLSDLPLLGTALGLTSVIVSLHVVGDGRRDILDPRQRLRRQAVQVTREERGLADVGRPDQLRHPAL
jgi:hypothetical protein